MKIVIDSNVWISAIVFGGNPRLVFESVVRNGLTIVASEEIFTEVRRIIENKFAAFSGRLDILKAILGVHLLVVSLGSEEVRVSRDEDDNRVIETAIIGRAQYIITGDKDLLVIGTYRTIKMITPADFMVQKLTSL